MLREKLGKLGDALTMLHIGLTGKAREIKEDENAMEVVQVVMLLAVGVIAIAAVWAGVNGLLGEIWGWVTGSASKQSLSLSTP